MDHKFESVTKHACAISSCSTSICDFHVSLVVDIGSTSIRCSAFQYQYDTVHEISGTCFRSHASPLVDGTLDAQCAANAVDSTISGCLSNLRRIISNPFTVDAVGFSSLAMSLVGVHVSTSSAATKVFTYATPLPECISSQNIFTPEEQDEHHKTTGTYIGHPSYALVHMISYYCDHPVSIPAVKWQSLASYIIGRWTATYTDCPISFSEASWWGLLDTNKKIWSHTALSRLSGLDVSDFLPCLSDIDQFEESLSQEYKTKWTEMSKAKIFLGIGDGAAANIGSAAQCKLFGISSEACITVGTSAAIRVIGSHHRVYDPIPGLWRYCVTGDLVIIGGALTDGGSLVEWFGNCFGISILEKSQEQHHITVMELQASSTWIPTSCKNAYLNGNFIIIYKKST